uniref:PGG domain-containing protein n=1 Tax=Lactuca sativa TaxID=4236 RepID=A0A9R1WBT6_LACSA|nr:hypothetical protein LSAT_V11C200094530 [Lactuca sativa]
MVPVAIYGFLISSAMAYQSSQKDITGDIKMQRSGTLSADYDNKTALHLAGSEGHDLIVEVLLHYKVDVNLTDRWHKTGKETNGMSTMGNRENITGDSSSSTGEGDEQDDSR